MKASYVESDADFQEFLALEAAYNAEKRRIETRKDKGFTREDRLKALRELGVKPEKPLHPIHTVGDSTIEGLIKNWADLRAGLGLFSAEGGQFTGGHPPVGFADVAVMTGMRRRGTSRQKHTTCLFKAGQPNAFWLQWRTWCAS